MRGRSWTVEEEEKLIELCKKADLTYEQIAGELERSYGSVEIRIRKLRKEGLLDYRNPKKIKNKYKKDLINVINLTPSGAYFIISLLCDGHLRKRNVQFKFRKRDCVEFRDIICNILKIIPPLNIWWRKASVYIWWQRGGVKKTIGECGEFRIYSRELVELLVTKYGLPMGKKSGIIRIPQRIMDSADAKIFGAIMRAAYECEGGVNLHKILFV